MDHWEKIRIIKNADPEYRFDKDCLDFVARCSTSEKELLGHVATARMYSDVRGVPITINLLTEIFPQKHIPPLVEDLKTSLERVITILTEQVDILARHTAP